jgi:formylglycine-generating enzyme required for sulfatase activity
MIRGTRLVLALTAICCAGCARKPVAWVDIDFVTVPAGQFMMGSDKGDSDEQPIHDVTITQPFQISRHEITQSAYEKIVGENPSRFKDPVRPVERVTWHDAVSFCRLLTDNERLTGRLTGSEIFRLPTEEEWEYCCRAGSTTIFSFGDEAAQLAAHAWYRDSAGDGTRPVGQLAPNAWGLHDMHGNVREWCYDLYEDYAAKVSGIPSKVEARVHRINRGGGFAAFPRGCRSSDRRGNTPPTRGATIGFRIVRAPPMDRK